MDPIIIAAAIKGTDKACLFERLLGGKPEDPIYVLTLAVGIVSLSVGSRHTKTVLDLLIMQGVKVIIILS